MSGRWREDEMGRIRLRVSIHIWPTVGVMDSFPNFHRTPDSGSSAAQFSSIEF